MTRRGLTDSEIRAAMEADEDNLEQYQEIENSSDDEVDEIIEEGVNSSCSDEEDEEQTEKEVQEKVSLYFELLL